MAVSNALAGLHARRKVEERASGGKRATHARAVSRKTILTQVFMFPQREGVYSAC